MGIKVPLLDLKAQFNTIRKEILDAVKEVFETQYFILGPKVKRFESEVGKYIGTTRAVGCASGSDALALALMAVGVGHGDEVVTSPYTFFATAGAIHRVGARPVFVDIDPATYNIDPQKTVDRLRSKVKAVIPVHLFGQCANIEPIVEAAGQRGITVIEDAAQAIGVKRNGKSAGTFGDFGCFSFFPSKNLGGAGDGGLVVTTSDEMEQKVRSLRVHGSSGRYYHKCIGINSRLDALQAAVLLVKLRYLEKWSEGRAKNAADYAKLFSEKGLTDRLTLPETETGNTHIYNQYVIRTPKRNELQVYLKEKGIGCAVYYPIPLHLQECFSYLGYNEGDFPESEKASRETLALPIYAEMTMEQKETVVDAVSDFLNK